MTAYTKYGRTAASTRQRLLQYIPALEGAGIEVDYQPLLGEDYVRSLATGEGFSRKAVMSAYARRMKRLSGDDGADLIWVYAELFPHLPGAFERLAFRPRKPLVYDFDDAFFHPYDHASGLKRLILGGKLEPLLAGARLCFCGNRYLQEYAARFCRDTMLLPTVVDTDLYRPVPKDEDRGLTIGWIGSSTTFRYLEPLLPLLQRLAERHSARIRIVGAGTGPEAVRREGVDMIRWTEDSEIAEVQRMDIGIMPLPDEEWARGKSGYKLVQYMACGLPVIASPVGVNVDIVRPGINGMLASSPAEWEAALSALLEDADLRRAMGLAGRDRAVAEYSLAAHAPRLTEALLAAGR